MTLGDRRVFGCMGPYSHDMCHYITHYYDLHDVHVISSSDFDDDNSFNDYR